MHKRIGLIGLGFAAALVASVVACGGDDGGAGAVCTFDSDCQTGELCHPDAQMCVQTCESGNDCPDSAKTCAAISGSDSRMICQCATDQLCAGETSDNICSTAFKICMPKCTSDVDCPTGYTCNTGSGQCAAGGGDAGACGWDTCSTTSWSGAAGQQCNNGTCGAGPSCSGTGQTTCTYGSFCSGGACGYPVYPTQSACSNFYSGSHASGPQWNPTSSTGPVIYEVSEINHGTGQTTGFMECESTATQWNVRVRAYRTDANWPDTRAGLSGFYYVNTSGNDQDIIGLTLLRPNVGYNRNASNPKDAEFQVYLCAENAANALQPGFYFAGGNEACRQL